MRRETSGVKGCSIKPHGLKIPLYGNQGDGDWTRV